MNLKREWYDWLVQKALEEDLDGSGDITSLAVFSEEKASAELIAKQDGILAGVEIAGTVFHEVDSTLEFEPFVKDGSLFQRGERIFRISGHVRSILTAERTALNFLGRLSGIATLTHKFVQQISGTRCKILDTRKTMPGWRRLEKYAVKMGGGENHRFGLFDMVLIKDNHIAAAGSIGAAVRRVREYLAERGLETEIEVEITSVEQLMEAKDLNVDRIMLDNMGLLEMREAVKICAGRIPLEASGNVRLETVREIAETGVDFISIGALTHSAPVCDFSLKIA